MPRRVKPIEGGPTLEELLSRLPKREYWFAEEIANAFGIRRNGFLRCAKLHGIGKLFKGKGFQPQAGYYVFRLEDLKEFMKYIKGNIQGKDKDNG